MKISTIINLPANIKAIFIEDELQAAADMKTGRTKTRSERGTSITEVMVSIALVAGLSTAATATLVNIGNDVEEKAQAITLTQIADMQTQADTLGTITMSAEDFKELTDKLTTTCSE